MGLFETIAFGTLGLLFLVLMVGILVAFIAVSITLICDEMRWDVPWERFKGDKKGYW